MGQLDLKLPVFGLGEESGEGPKFCARRALRRHLRRAATLYIVCLALALITLSITSRTPKGVAREEGV